MLAAGCGDPEETRWEGLPATSLPSRGIDADCGLILPPPEACVWALGADAVVWGTLADVRLERFPAISADGDLTLRMSCPSGVVNPAMELDIDVDRVLAGNVSTGPLTVRIGSRQITQYNPSPRFGDDDSIEWYDGRDPGGPLVVGQPIGITVHWVDEHELWSVMGEALFGVGIEPDETRVLAFQRHIGFCESPVPMDVPGKTLAEAEALLSACVPSAESAARRERMEGEWGNRPDYSFAGICF